MRPFALRFWGLAALPLATGLVAARAEALTVLPATPKQHALAVELDGNAVKAQACAKRCADAEGERFAMPAEADASKATLERIELRGGRQVALVRAPLVSGTPGCELDGGCSWVLLLAATAPPAQPTVVKTLVGTTGRAKGIEGERERRQLLIEPGSDGATVAFGTQYESAQLCGRWATLDVKELVDPSGDDNRWRPGATRGLSADERRGAAVLDAKRVPGFGLGEPRLLYGTVASSAVGRLRSGLTDRDLTTAWVESKLGAGAGEFLVMSATSRVPVTGFELALTDTARPQRMFIATADAVFAIEVPAKEKEDATAAPNPDANPDADPDARETTTPAEVFRVTLPRPLESDCYALVLDTASVTDADHGVGLRELRAITPLDGSDDTALAAALSDADKHRVAKELLLRGGAESVRAAIDAYPTAGAGREHALDVIDAGACVETTTFYVSLLLGDGKDERDFVPTLDREAQHARQRLRGCRKQAVATLIQRMRDEGPTERRIWAARELAGMAPAESVPAILAVLADGSTAPEQAGGADAVRRGLRGALSVAVGNRRAAEAVAAQLAPERFGELALVEQIDLLRALGPALAEQGQAAGALQATLSRDQAFRTRFLLLEPSAHLARAGDTKALGFLRGGLGDESPHIRARAAEVSGALEPLVPQLVTALSDSSPRVRRAGLVALSESAAHIDDNIEMRIANLLQADPWPFVRSEAAVALAQRAPSAKTDEALIAALDDEALRVRRAVLQAIGRRDSQSAAERVAELADNAKLDVPTRVAAISTLGDLCRHDEAELLYKLALRAGFQQLPYDQPLGLAALAALGEIRPPDLAQRLAPLVTKDKRIPPIIRQIARDVLRREGSCPAAPTTT